MSCALASAVCALLMLSCASASMVAEAGQRKEAGGAGGKQRASAAQRAKERRRREEAVAALVETADAARKFEDLAERAAAQTLAADALWTADETSARAIFRRAWEAATEADRAPREEGLNGEAAARVASNGGTASSLVTTARDEVLGKVAARSPQLAELFLKEMLREISDERATQPDETRARRKATTWGELSGRGGRRLALADELLRGGEAASAVEVAAPLVSEGVSAEFLNFLLRARRLAPREADALYLRLLEASAADASADANDALLLSSYVVSPAVLLVIDERGGLMLRPVLYDNSTETDGPPDVATAPPEPAADVRRAFFRAAATILLRPPSSQTSADAPLQNAPYYFAISRLLPFFEREAPQRAPELHARLAALAVELEAARRDALSARADLQSVTQKNPSDPLRSLLDRLAQARDAKMRDRTRLLIVRVAAHRRMWERARTIAAEIEDADARRVAQTVIALSQIKTLARDFGDETPDDYERAAAYVRGLDVPPVARAAAYVQTATLAARKGNRARASELLAEAARYAESAEAGTYARAAALGFVARAAATLEPARAWEMLPTFVRALNAVEEEESEPTKGVGLDADASAYSELDELIETFHLEELFATIGRIDLTRSLREARSLKDEAARAYAVIAAARAALERDAAKTSARATR